MLAKKVFYIFLFFLAIDLFMACCKCISPYEGVFAHKSVSMLAIDNRGEFPVLANSDTLNKNAFGFRVTFTREQVVCASPSFSLLSNNAYAMKCDCSGQFVFIPGDTISDIQVFTLNDFDSAHLANSDITEYWQHYHQKDLDKLNHLRSELNHALESRDGLIKSEDILLMVPPALGKMHQFKLKLTLSNGKVIEVTSLPVVLI